MTKSVISLSEMIALAPNAHRMASNARDQQEWLAGAAWTEATQWAESANAYYNLPQPYEPERVASDLKQARERLAAAEKLALFALRKPDA